MSHQYLNYVAGVCTHLSRSSYVNLATRRLQLIKKLKYRPALQENKF